MISCIVMIIFYHLVSNYWRSPIWPFKEEQHLELRCWLYQLHGCPSQNAAGWKLGLVLWRSQYRSTMGYGYLGRVFGDTGWPQHSLLTARWKLANHQQEGWNHMAIRISSGISVLSQKWLIDHVEFCKVFLQLEGRSQSPTCSRPKNYESWISKCPKASGCGETQPFQREVADRSLRSIVQCMRKSCNFLSAAHTKRSVPEFGIPSQCGSSTLRKLTCFLKGDHFKRKLSNHHSWEVMLVLGGVHDFIETPWFSSALGNRWPGRSSLWCLDRGPLGWSWGAQ